ncbi:uncharacterized protein GGS25DRAFT_519786 [Hypoxylon fragiforme]|uniref:uncharacterized protein n=1 Tax=Hypoxylon fragiforme TaxID=63214 RepID=UPI0020C6040E|nr:uncharacterized protein GGS25DRAFT_519786 [Hypoxylon fragiforme]KAI2611478.1 hypothetical protein GGS25DRAFT_519786 [Hypoxylon fragiforme]
MQLPLSTFLLLSATTALATRLSVAVDAEWTIEGLSRTCDDADTTCLWTFGIDTNEEGAEVVAANYTVNASSDAPASRAIGGPEAFGNYTVTSTWSGQFGEGEGFTTLSVIDYGKGLIVYPGYRDVEIPNGKVYTPDKSYPVQQIP